MTTRYTSSPTAGNDPESHNLDEFYNRIHLTLWVPYGTPRAQAMCGAKLREGFKYDTVENYLQRRLRTSPTAQWVHIRWRQTHKLDLAADYLLRICPACLESEDYALALLANTP